MSVVRWLVRFESACAAVIEHAFARAFPNRLEPARIARKLVATFEASPPGTSRFIIRVNPSDHARLATYRRYLEHQWEQMLAELARNLGIGLHREPDVRLASDDAVVAGAIVVEALTSIEAAEPRTQTEALRIRVIRGLPPGLTRVIDGEIVIGRDGAADVVIPDLRVSRRHARIFSHRQEVLIADEGSTNGTYVNGERISTAVLSEGDRVKIGATEFAVETAGSSAA